MVVNRIGLERKFLTNYGNFSNLRRDAGMDRQSITKNYREYKMNKFLTKSMEKIFNTLGSNLDEFKDKTILITGANGLIGGFLSEFFIYLNDDHDFNCKLLLTSLSDDPKRLGDLIYRKDVQYYSRDLTNDSWFFNEIDFCIYVRICTTK